MKIKKYENFDFKEDWEEEPEKSKNECFQEVNKRFSDDKFINNVCLSYRHDFGLMDDEEREILKFECKEWMRAITNNWRYYEG